MIIVKIYLGLMTKFIAVMNLKGCPASLKVEIYNLNQRYVCRTKFMLKFALIVINGQRLCYRSLTKYKNKHCFHSLLKNNKVKIKCNSVIISEKFKMI